MPRIPSCSPASSVAAPVCGVCRYIVGRYPRIRNRSGTLRYVGLALFSIVAVKVFFADLASLDQIYRIVAFILLGFLVLAGSFLYMKYRHTFEIEPDPQKRIDP